MDPVMGKREIRQCLPNLWNGLSEFVIREITISIILLKQERGLLKEKACWNECSIFSGVKGAANAAVVFLLSLQVKRY